MVANIPEVLAFSIPTNHGVRPEVPFQFENCVTVNAVSSMKTQTIITTRHGPYFLSHLLPYRFSVSCLLRTRTSALCLFPVQPTKHKKLRPRGREGMDWELGVSRCKVLHTGRINNEVSLYSMGNCIQYPVINHNGKNMKKNVCMYN